MLSAMGFEPKTRTLRVGRLLILTTHPQCWHAQGAAAHSGIGNPGLTIWTRVFFFLFSFQIYDFFSNLKTTIIFSKNIKKLAEFTLSLPKKKNPGFSILMVKEPTNCRCKKHYFRLPEWSCTHQHTTMDGWWVVVDQTLFSSGSCALANLLIADSSKSVLEVLKLGFDRLDGLIMGKLVRCICGCWVTPVDLNLAPWSNLCHNNILQFQSPFQQFSGPPVSRYLRTAPGTGKRINQLRP